MSRHRIKSNKYGVTSGRWFAWYPIRTGALGTGRMVWLRRVWFCDAMGVTIYQIDK